MSHTLEEVLEYLREHHDPDEILDLLQINSEELLDRFEDKVLYYLDKLQKEINDESRYYYDEGVGSDEGY